MKPIAALSIVILSVVAPRTSTVRPADRQPTSSDSACSPIRNVDSVLVRGRVTSFGEMHGTEQMPAFVGNVLCHAAKRHLPTTLALELASESSRNLDDFVHAKGDSVSARNALLSDSIWHGSSPTAAPVWRWSNFSRLCAASREPARTFASSHSRGRRPRLGIPRWRWS